MATILLDKNESFEHFHTQPSHTVLEDGEVQLVMNGEAAELQKGVTMLIPTNTSHTMVNTGDSTATITCIHVDA